MRWSKWWLFLFVAGIAAMTTVYYFTVVEKEKESYAQGRMVQEEQLFGGYVAARAEQIDWMEGGQSK